MEGGAAEIDPSCFLQMVIPGWPVCTVWAMLERRSRGYDGKKKRMAKLFRVAEAVRVRSDSSRGVQ